METKDQPVSPILEIAWTRFAQLDAAAVKRSRAYITLRRSVIMLGVLATFFAITIQLYPESLPAAGLIALKVLLVASPIMASAIAAYINHSYSSGDWLVTRAGAEELLKNIYLYRTILQKKKSTRRNWLQNKLKENQRSIFNGMNGELVLDQYEGIIPPPPRFDPQNPDHDPGFDDLDGNAYFKYRLEDQLAWHILKVGDRQSEMRRLQFFVLASGGIGAVFAAIGAWSDGPFVLWVALIASFTSALICWQELRNLDIVVRNYSKVIMELQILYDHWKALEPRERTQSEFFKMVRATEDTIGSRNMEYIRSMQEALKEDDLEEEAGLITRIIQEQRESDRQTKQDAQDIVVESASTILEEGEEELRETFKQAIASLPEEASSEIVQAEIESMQNAITDVGAEEVTSERSAGFLASSLETIAEEFGNIDLGRDTPKDVLNEIIRRYPKTQEVKG
jgi:hypothetical protein